MAFYNQSHSLGNAASEPITTAQGRDTYGALNQHPSRNTSYQIGISHAQGPRPTLEDTYGFVVDFDAVRGQGLFGVFDGHGNKLAAEWCGKEFHKYLHEELHRNETATIEQVLHDTFLNMDNTLSTLSKQSGQMAASGCTAVIAFLRLEDQDQKQSFAQHPDHLSSSSASRNAKAAIEPPSSAKRVLYCANAGDARAVLSRSGVATRLSFDHKASDPTESKRIKGAGGIIFKGRVLGTLNVTRSLGNHESFDDFSLKRYIIGTPYTSRTALSDTDEFLILACDGLWDVVTDQQAVELIRGIESAQEASDKLLQHAMQKGTYDNVTVQVVRFGPLKRLFSTGESLETPPAITAT